MALTLGVTGIIAIAAGGGGAVIIASLIVIALLIRRQRRKKANARHNQELFRPIGHGHSTIHGQPWGGRSALQSQRTLGPDPRDFHNEWCVKKSAYIPRPRLLKKARNSIFSANTSNYQKPTEDSLRRIMAVQAKRAEIAKLNSVAHSPMIPERNEIPSYGAWQSQNRSTMNLPEIVQHRGNIATPLKPMPLFHGKQRSISNSVLESASQYPNLRASPPFAKYNQMPDAQNRLTLKHSSSLQCNHSGEISSSPMPMTPSMAYRARRNYICYADSPSKSPNFSRTMADSSIPVRDCPLPFQQPGSHTSGLPCDQDILDHDHIVDFANSGIHSQHLPRKRSRLSHCRNSIPRTSNPSSNSQRQPAQIVSVADHAGTAVSDRNSKRISQALELPRDESSSLSISLLKYTTPRKVNEPGTYNLKGNLADGFGVRARDTPLIPPDNCQNDVCIFGYGNHFIVPKSDESTMFGAASENSITRFSNLIRVDDRKIERECHLSKLQMRRSDGLVRMSIIDPQTSLLPANTTATGPEPLPADIQPDFQRISFIVPIPSAIPGTRSDFDSIETSQGQHTSLSRSNGVEFAPAPGLRIAKPKPLRVARPPSSTVFNPNFTLVLPQNRDPNLFVSSSLPQMNAKANLANLASDASLYSLPAVRPQSTQRDAEDDLRLATPTVNPSERRSKIDPKRLSSTINPPVQLRPTPTRQSSLFSFETGNLFANLTTSSESNLRASPALATNRGSMINFRFSSNSAIEGHGNRFEPMHFLCASPPPTSPDYGADPQGASDIEVTPLDRYRHMYARFPEPSNGQSSIGPLESKPPDWRLNAPASPRPMIRTLPPSPSKKPQGPRPPVGSKRKSKAYPTRKQKGKSASPPRSPLRFVYQPSSSSDAAPEQKEPATERADDNKNNDTDRVKNEPQPPTEGLKAKPEPDESAPLTLQLINQLRRHNSEYDNEDLYQMLQADVHCAPPTPIIPTSVSETLQPAHALYTEVVDLTRTSASATHETEKSEPEHLKTLQPRSLFTRVGRTNITSDSDPVDAAPRHPSPYGAIGEERTGSHGNSNGNGKRKAAPISPTPLARSKSRSRAVLQPTSSATNINSRNKNRLSILPGLAPARHDTPELPTLKPFHMQGIEKENSGFGLAKDDSTGFQSNKNGDRNSNAQAQAAAASKKRKSAVGVGLGIGVLGRELDFDFEFDFTDEMERDGRARGSDARAGASDAPPMSDPAAHSHEKQKETSHGLFTGDSDGEGTAHGRCGSRALQLRAVPGLGAGTGVAATVAATSAERGRRGDRDQGKPRRRKTKRAVREREREVEIGRERERRGETEKGKGKSAAEIQNEAFWEAEMF